MKQFSLAATGFELSTKRTRQRSFLAQTGAFIPWTGLLLVSKTLC
jgi:hypothetical protein